MKGQSKEINYPIRPTNVQTDGTPGIDLDNRKQLYRAISEVIANIPITNRNVGLTVTIYNENGLAEYWWEKGIKDSDLVLKFNSKDIPNLQAIVVDLQHQIDNVNNIEFKVFNSLPAVGNSSIIYVVPNPVGTEEDDYIEYFWIKSEQRYERFGGLNASGGITINNFYTFDENVFTVDEESDYKNVYLNSKKISIVDKGIKIYKLDIGEEDNEEFIYIQNYSRTVGNSVNSGGAITLNGKLIATGQTDKDYQTLLFYDRLEVSYEQGINSYRAVLGASELHIEDSVGEVTVSTSGIQYSSDSRNNFELNNDNLISRTNKIILEALSDDDGFNISVNGNGIYSEFNSSVNEHYIHLNSNESYITIKPYEINIEITDYSSLKLDTVSAILKASDLIYLNSDETQVDLLSFKQSTGAMTYFQGYHLNVYSTTYHGIKASTPIYLVNANPYYITQDNGINYALVSYGLNSINYRKGNTPSGLGSSIISWNEENKYPILKLGLNNQIIIKDKYVELNATTNNYIKLNNEGALINGNVVLLKTSLNRKLFIDESTYTIGLYSNNSSKIEINEDANELTAYHRGSKFYIDGDGNISMYRGNDNRIFIDSNSGEIYLKSIDGIYMRTWQNCGISINSDGDVNVNASSYFNVKSNGGLIIDVKSKDKIILGNKTDNCYIETTIGRNNYGNPVARIIDFITGANNLKMEGEATSFKFTVSDVVYNILFSYTGITYSDGTNSYTKTWAQLLS